MILFIIKLYAPFIEIFFQQNEQKLAQTRFKLESAVTNEMVYHKKVAEPPFKSASHGI